jgi:hypothetical protein
MQRHMLSLKILLLATLLFPWNFGIQARSIQVKVTLRVTVSQSVLVSSPIWGLWPDIYYGLTVTVFLMLGALSDERTGLPFKSSQFPFLYSLNIFSVRTTYRKHSPSIVAWRRPQRKHMSRVELQFHWRVTSTGRDADSI